MVPGACSAATHLLDITGLLHGPRGRTLPHSLCCFRPEEPGHDPGHGSPPHHTGRVIEALSEVRSGKSALAANWRMDAQEFWVEKQKPRKHRASFFSTKTRAFKSGQIT